MNFFLFLRKNLGFRVQGLGLLIKHCGLVSAILAVISLGFIFIILLNLFFQKPENICHFGLFQIEFLFNAFELNLQFFCSFSKISIGDFAINFNSIQYMDEKILNLQSGTLQNSIHSFLVFRKLCSGCLLAAAISPSRIIV